MRNSAARLNRTIIDSIFIKDPNAKIFVMGDLNDNPNNESVKSVLSSKNDLKGLSNSDLYNPFYKSSNARKIKKFKIFIARNL